jgi:hypothetical protein
MYLWETVGKLVLACRKVFQISVVCFSSEILTTVIMNTNVICEMAVEMW